MHFAAAVFFCLIRKHSHRFDYLTLENVCIIDDDCCCFVVIVLHHIYCRLAYLFQLVVIVCDALLQRTANHFYSILFFC